MRILFPQSALLVIALTVGLGLPSARAQTGSGDEAYQAARRHAMELFDQSHHLEALPLLEDLTKKRPDDADVLVALATCLVSHTSTVEDQKDATRERLRARELLLRAKQLGNTSALLQNLLQTIPEDGVISYSQDAADQALRLGEAAFARRDFDEAIRNYTKVLELDPKRYSATLFIGDTYFAKKDFAKAGEWYERAIQLDPNRETAYRYYADMLVKNGDMVSSRRRFIQAVVAEPYNSITWRALQAWARTNGVQLREVHLRPRSEVSQKDDQNITLTLEDKQSGDAGAAWTTYGIVKTLWHMTDFKKNFPQEQQYRHSLPEESQALSSAAEFMTSNRGKKKKAALAHDEDLALLVRLYEARMIEPYVLLSAPDAGISQDYAAYRDKNRDHLERYLSEFIVPSPPATGNPR
jgi:tetratricopeptide (TPR) repeat protein